ncbi:hypothetical protein ACVMAJ_000499 [Bradyrhizobium sp. USDA 4448]
MRCSLGLAQPQRLDPAARLGQLGKLRAADILDVEAALLADLDQSVGGQVLSASRSGV